MLSPFSRSTLAVALFAGLSFPSAAFGAEPSLTLGEAQRLAVLRSRQLAGIESSAVSSRELAVAAGQLPDPVLKAGIDNLPVSGADRFSLGNDFMTMRRIGVVQELPGSDKRHWRAEGYVRNAARAEAEKASATAAIRRDAAAAWLDCYFAQEAAKLAAEQAAQARLESEAADTAYRAGRGGQADVLAARGATAMADDRASEAGLRLRQARTQLARWTGSGADATLANPPAIDTIGLDPALLETQAARHPQMAVLARQEDIAQAEAKLAEAGQRPDWSVELAFQQRGSAYANMVSVGLSVPLQWDRKKRQDRELSAKLAQVEQARAEHDEALRAHVADIRATMQEWENGRERYARYERELLPLAADRIQAVLAAYRGGKSTLPELLAARRNEIELRLQALQLRAATARLWAQLNFLFPENAQ